MKHKDIIDAYVRIRTIDHTIPDDVLDFMKDSAISCLVQEPKVEEQEKQKVIVFDSHEWDKTGDVGDNSKFYKQAEVIEERFDHDCGWLVDVKFPDGRISRGHFKCGVKFIKSEPEEQLKEKHDPSPVSLDTHTAEEYLIKTGCTIFFVQHPNTIKGSVAVIPRNEAMKAMTEYASQESLKARQEHQESINKALDRLNFADKSLVKHPDCYTDDRIQSALDFISTAFHELSKLKSDSRNHPSDTKKDSSFHDLNH